MHNDRLSSEAISRLREFADLPVNRFCQASLNAFRSLFLNRDTSLNRDEMEGSRGSFYRAVFLNDWSLAALSPLHYWALHLSKLMPFEFYLTEVSPASVSGALYSLESRVVNSRHASPEPVMEQLIADEIICFIFDIAFADGGSDSLLKSKCDFILRDICLPHQNAHIASSEVRMLSSLQVRTSWHVVEVIGSRLSPEDACLLNAFIEFQLRLLFSVYNSIVITGDDDSGYPCAVEMIGSQVQPSIFRRSVEMALTVEREASCLDYSAPTSLLRQQSALYCPFLLLLWRLIKLNITQSPADFVMTFAAVAVAEKHSQLFLRCLCLVESNALWAIQADKHYFSVYSWFEKLFAQLSLNKNKVEDNAFNISNFECNPGSIMLFICRALVESIYFHHPGTLSGICRWLRENRAINKDAVDEYMAVARHRLKCIESVNILISGYSSDTSSGGGLELNADRIQSWAQSVAESHLLPSAVRQFCSFRPSGQQYVLSRMACLVRAGEVRFGDCEIIAKAMASGDHAISRAEDIENFIAQCERCNKVNNAIKSICSIHFAGLHSNLEIGLKGVFELVAALCDLARSKKCSSEFEVSNIIVAKWKDSCLLAISAVGGPVDTIHIRKIHALLVVTVVDICCAVATGRSELHLIDPVDRCPEYLNSWIFIISQLSSIVHEESADGPYVSAVLSLFSVPSGKSDSNVHNKERLKGLGIFLVSIKSSVSLRVMENIISTLSGHPSSFLHLHWCIEMLLVIYYALENIEYLRTLKHSETSRKRKVAEMDENFAGVICKSASDLEFNNCSIGNETELLFCLIWIFESIDKIRNARNIFELLPKSCLQFINNAIINKNRHSTQSPVSSFAWIRDFLAIRDKHFRNLISWGLGILSCKVDGATDICRKNVALSFTQTALHSFFFVDDFVRNLENSLLNSKPSDPELCPAALLWTYVTQSISHCISRRGASVDSIAQNFLALFSEVLLSELPNQVISHLLPVWLELSIVGYCGEPDVMVNRQIETKFESDVMVYIANCLIITHYSVGRLSQILEYNDSTGADLNCWIGVFLFFGMSNRFLMHEHIYAALFFNGRLQSEVMQSQNSVKYNLLFATCYALALTNLEVVASTDCFVVTKWCWAESSIQIKYCHRMVHLGFSDESIRAIASIIKNVLEGKDLAETIDLLFLCGQMNNEYEHVHTIAGRLQILGGLLYSLPTAIKPSCLDFLKCVTRHIKSTFEATKEIITVAFLSEKFHIADYFSLELLGSHLAASLLAFDGVSGPMGIIQSIEEFLPAVNSLNCVEKGELLYLRLFLHPISHCVPRSLLKLCCRRLYRCLSIPVDETALTIEIERTLAGDSI